MRVQERRSREVDVELMEERKEEKEGQLRSTASQPPDLLLELVRQ